MLKFPNPTPAQALLLHTLEGLLGSALLAGFTAGGQDIWTGNVDLKTVVTVGIAAFFASFLKGYTTSVKPQDQVQAVLDTVGEIQGLLTGLLQQPAAQTVVVAQQSVKPAPQPIVLGTPFTDNAPATQQPNLNQPMAWGIQSVPEPVQNPQAMPAVQPTPALPVQLPHRHFGDTGIVPVPTTGQGS